jgi:hypothetical protein
MPACPKCKSDNPDNNKFCGSCGTEMPPAMELRPVVGEDGAFYCAKHKSVVTRLRCGRCEAPICPKCIVYTPAGTRCRDCSRNRVAVRPMGLLNEAGRVVDNVASSRGANRVWYLALWYLIIEFFERL